MGIVRELGLGAGKATSERHGPATLYRSDGRPTTAENCRLPDGTRTAVPCVTAPPVTQTEGRNDPINPAICV